MLDRRESSPIPCRQLCLRLYYRMTIKAYLKPSCGWSNGVRAVLRKYGLDYQDIDIIGDRENYSEMVRKSGQPLSPASRSMASCWLMCRVRKWRTIS